MGTQSHRKHHDYAPAQHHLEYPGSAEHGQQGWLDATEQRARILVLTPAMCRDRERERATRLGKAQLRSSSRQLPERAQRLSRTGSPGSCLGRTKLVAMGNSQQGFPASLHPRKAASSSSAFYTRAPTIRVPSLGHRGSGRAHVSGLALVPVTLVTAASEHSQILGTTSGPKQCGLRNSPPKLHVLPPLCPTQLASPRLTAQAEQARLGTCFKQSAFGKDFRHQFCLPHKVRNSLDTLSMSLC